MAEVLHDTDVPDPPSDALLARAGLTREEYLRACELLKRQPNLVELGIFGAMWSEHCSYKSSKRHLKKLPADGSHVLVGPGENAGVIDLGNDYAVVFKIESHNHPSAVEPFQGAATGVGGIIRDIFAMGARPIACLDSLRFGNLTPLPPVGVPPEDDETEDEATDSGLAGTEPGPTGGMADLQEFGVDWNAEPPPYVCTLAWLTHLRRQVFSGSACRRAVREIRKLHGELAGILAYCVLPDQVLLAACFPGGGEEDANTLVSALKANLAQVAGVKARPGEDLWEEGFRAQRKQDATELAEAIKHLEFTPVLRGAATQIKEYPYVSAVWKHGVAFPGDGGAGTDVGHDAPYCPGVTEEQAARNRYLLGGVVGGIAHYGNCIGIPTIGGEVAFDPSYASNCLVNVMCVGIARKDSLLSGVAEGVGNTALIVGAKTGRDGVQGATFASGDLAEDSAADRPAVQVGDPFMEKLLLEATLEILKLDGLVGVQDFGAAGLTCSSVEMAARAGCGMRLDLDKVPQRARDLSAYEMMLSESQERMMVVVEKGKEQAFNNVFKKWGLSASPCGEVIDKRELIVVHGGHEVVAIPNAALTEMAPDYDRPADEPAGRPGAGRLHDSSIALALKHIESLGEVRSVAGISLAPPESTYENLLRALLSDPSIASKRPIYQQYDYMVRTNTVAGPTQAGAAVLRIKETGQGLSLATDGSARHVLLDPQLGGARAVLEAARNVLSTGARPLGITNCLNFGNPEKPGRMWQFVQCIEGMRLALSELELPVTGGNVSFYNEAAGASIMPTPVIGMVGLLDDAEKFIPGCVQEHGYELYLLGAGEGRLDGSALLFELGRLRAGELAAHDYNAFRSCERFLIDAASQGALAACQDISDGGLLTAVFELSGCGASLDLSKVLTDDYDVDEHNRLAALFGEEGHRWVIAVDPRKRSRVRTAAMHYSVPLEYLGETADGTLTVSAGGEVWIECQWEPLRICYSNGLSAAMQG
ncbi:phosphoribosylformylglycinamidine synthase subunit PurL [bacterium]|nr:phosphoribosylformylglycinamidine synthase subunit PurL [bacterium]